MWIDVELRKGLCPSQIYQRAAKALFAASHEGMHTSLLKDRDHFITLDDIHNRKRKIDRELWKRHENDVVSVHLWILANPPYILCYQQQSHQPYSPLRICVQTPLQLKWLLKYGNGGCLAIDGTFGVHKYKV